MKFALYARVSRPDENLDNQIIQLRQFAAAHQYEVEGSYYETESTRDFRPVKELLLHKLFMKEIEGVIFVSLDRWGRSSRELILDFERALQKGYTYISIKEMIDLSSASGKMQFVILAAFAEFERARISERTIAGLQRARQSGKKLGRPQIPEDKKSMILWLSRSMRLKAQQIRKEMSAKDHKAPSLSTIKNIIRRGKLC